MQFGLTESQKILKDNARKFFSAECAIGEVRRLMETETAYDASLWGKMAEQGFTGIIFPEEFGGLGLGYVELILLLEEMGYGLVPGPFFSTVALAGTLLDACGSDQQKKTYLEPICQGRARATASVALDSGAADGKITVANGKLTGRRLFVPDAGVADFILVATGSGVFVVDRKSPGLAVSPMKGMDLTRKIYSLEFSNTPAEKLANSNHGPRAVDLATAALVAEMVGGMQRTLDLTVQYAKTRKQFGKVIGSFQAVQHQCAEMYLETESSRSAAYYAAWALQENTPDAAVSVSIAKMYASDACRNVGNHGIQVHGGMGFTWENDLHLLYRRAKASETMFGDATWHRERIAKLVIDAEAASAQTAKSA
jgi:alkylation response protein AidB-like acyl-CoA dehydrogenase